MAQSLNFAALPDLLQVAGLKEVVTRLWQHDPVAVWLGGSLAAGKLVILTCAWQYLTLLGTTGPDLTALFGAEPLAHTPMPFGERSFYID